MSKGANQPKHDYDQHDRAEQATPEPGATPLVVAIVSTPAPEQQKDNDNDQDQAHFTPLFCL
jgi:hypothetical protein